MVFAFVWASFLPPLRPNNYKDDVLGELVTKNNNEPPQSEVNDITKNFCFASNKYTRSWTTTIGFFFFIIICIY